jgi:hypothetical protein
MNQTRVYVGLDVDDTQYHGSALNKGTGEVIRFPMPADVERPARPAREASQACSGVLAQAML